MSTLSKLGKIYYNEILVFNYQKNRLSHVAIEDRFGQSGATGELLEAYGITKENIAAKAMALCRRQ